MQDDKLWYETKAAPSALATADLTLEWAITESLRKTFGLSKDDCAIVMLEYRKFRYMRDVAEGQISPSPLMAFVQSRDMPNSSAFAEIKHWWGGAGRSLTSASLSFVHEPAYKRAVDLYQQEFAATPPCKIWPTRLQAHRKNQASVAFGLGLAAVIVGDWVKSDITSALGFVLCFLAFGYLVFLGRHWAEPPGDA
ncbi:hypothetical protein [Cypionkella sp. TWP1-2-1b2]|uniref:hypothetical protein n=1 Tax=Cypionkella sp. TWP1-2-1b2 TaxID=2804675 RepID=UPI003CF27CC2